MLGMAILLWIDQIGSLTGNLMSGLAGALVVFWLTNRREKIKNHENIKKLRALFIIDINKKIDLSQTLLISYDKIKSFYEGDPNAGFEDETFPLFHTALFENVSQIQMEEVVGYDQFLNFLTFYKEVEYCYENKPVNIIKEAGNDKHLILRSPNMNDDLISLNFRNIETSAIRKAQLCKDTIKDIILPVGNELLLHLQQLQERDQ